ncbi:hypothetical protein [Euzebya rosea]|uniref:hypothetical protein n=1 Tax=Euzebya rosea TaxID=2052804 RepID=UPI000D3EA7DE|nr:hypothetical protein [Euzebya rosea]
MQIGSGTFGVRSATAYQFTRRTPQQVAPSDDTLRTQLRRVDEEIEDLRALLQKTRTRGARASAATIRGTNPVMQATGDSATLRSRVEVNTEATQLSTRTPQWSAPTGRDVTIRGLWEGTTDEVLTFTVTSNDGRSIDVTDANGDRVDRFKLHPDSTRDRTMKVLNGDLTVEFAGGVELQRGDTFTLEVSASTDGAIDPDDPFDGVGLSSPRFEEGTVIRDGQFLLNGVAVAVNASDSLNDVLARIEATVEGVSASYDAATERVSITTLADGSDTHLEISDDTSGLIAALKLDHLGRATGTDGPQDAPMATIPQFQSVTAGTISVNGVEIGLDPATDSVADIVSLIDALEDVSARIEDGGGVVITGRAGADMTLLDGGTGFFEALGVEVGVHAGRQAKGRRLSDLAARKIAAEVSQLREALDALLDNEGLIGNVADMRTRIGVAVEVALRDAEGVGDFASLTAFDDFDADKVRSRARVTRELRHAYSDVRTLMLGESRRTGGLLDQLADIVDDGLAAIDGFDTRV